MSMLFRQLFPHVGASAIWDASQLYLAVFRRNRQAFFPNSHLSGHFIPAIIPGNSLVSPRQYLARKPSDRPYLHENTNLTPNALFSFLYNGFRDSRFTRICRSATTGLQVARAHGLRRPASLACNSPAQAAVYADNSFSFQWTLW